MAMITCSKVYHSPKIDKKNRKYDLISIYAGQDRYSIFDYDAAHAGLQEGDSLDLSGFEQKPNEYQGKTSIVLSKPRKTAQAAIPSDLEERLVALEDKVKKIRDFLASKYGN